MVVDSSPPPLKTPVRHKSNRGDDGWDIWRGTLGYVGASCSGRWRLRAFWGDLDHHPGWGHPAGQGFPGDVAFEKRNGNDPVMLTRQAKPWLQAWRFYWSQMLRMRGDISSWHWWSLSPPRNKSTGGIETFSRIIKTNTNKQSPILDSFPGILMPSESL